MTSPALWAIALACALGFVALGHYVTHVPLVPIDAPFTRLFGRGVPLARLFTVSGYARVVVVVIALSAAASALGRVSLVPIVVIAAIQGVSQGAIVLIKDVFARRRPERWRYRRELGMSYPSGHAATAVVLYGLLFRLAYRDWEPPAIRDVLLAVLAAWVVGICWSRLALGAHYASDVLGGALLGVSFASAGLALFHFV